MLQISHEQRVEKKTKRALQQQQQQQKVPN